MTSETKIGLLVGLAFIIVIGILFSNYVSSSNEPPQAALTGAGSGVRQAVNSPGSGGAGAPVTVITPIITPQQQVATQRELSPAPSPVIVRIGPAIPAVATQQTDRNDTTPALADGTNSDPAITPVPAAPTAQKPTTPTNDELARVAQSHGEPLVGLNDSRPARLSTDYIVQPGDSLSRIAAKLLGSSSKANIDLIVKANPSLHGDPNKIVAGKTYQIPTAAAAKAAAAPASPVAAAPAAHDADDAIAQPANSTVPKGTRTAASDATAYFYTVLAGDTLTKIAREQVGDIHAIAAIQELNGDTLKGDKKDMVITGTKIRLPGKPLAKAD